MMTEQQPYTQLVMMRERLDRLPELRPWPGYGVRSLLPGDEAAWEHIVEASFGTRYEFAGTMASQEPYRPEHVWFVCEEGGSPVATATAWHRPEWGADTGYLHMVGVLPAHAGRKLGYTVSLAALLDMAHSGKTRAVLHTDDHRTPAVKTYLNLAFVPVLAGDDHRERWERLAGMFGTALEAADMSGGRVTLGGA